MEQRKKTRKFLITHYQRYPRLQIQDLLKFLHQSSFGCEHMVTDLDAVIERIRKESEIGSCEGTHLKDELDGEYSRIHLSYLQQGLSVETLGTLFLKSAQNEPKGIHALEEKLCIAKELLCEKELPFSVKAFEEATSEWKRNGYPALHHSDKFREVYHPSYRVIANRYVPFLPVLAKIDEMLQEKSVVIAIEGGSASGKTTFSEMLKDIYDCNVLHMDDFFLRPEQRTPERFAEAGGNIDRERFLEEVLMPLSKNETISYRRLDCSTFTMCPSVEIIPKKLTIIEGAYSMHPAFEKYYDLSVFLDVSKELQKQRIEKRNTAQMVKRFFEEWIPLENIYFSEMKVKERCNLSITV